MRNFEYFKKCKEDNTPVKVTFVQIDKEHQQYVAYEGNLRIALSLSEVFGVSEDALEEIWKTSRIGQALGQETEVFIKEADKETGMITCSRQGIRVAGREKAKEEIDKILDQHNNETVPVRGRIIAIVGEGSNSRAILLTENGLKLVLFCKKWSYDFIDDLKDVANVGDVIDVVIYAKNNTKTEGDYLVSRAETFPNPWEGIEKRFHKGDIVECKVVKRWNEAFGGRIDGVEGILAYVAFPKDKNLRIVVGEKYICSVGGVKGETRTFRLYPFAVKK